MTEQQKIYRQLFDSKKLELRVNGYTEDKSNRLANIHAIKNTTTVWRAQTKRV